MENNSLMNFITNSSPQILLFSRHPETEGNKDHSVYKKIPEPQVKITKEGEMQAEAAAQNFLRLIQAIEQKEIPSRFEKLNTSGYQGKCEVIIHRSPYPRLDYYTKCVQKALGDRVIHVDQNELLREISWGDMEGMTWQEASEKFPFNFARNRKYKEHAKPGCEKNGDNYHHRFPNGESPASVVDRVATHKNMVMMQHICLQKNVIRIFLVHDYILRALTMVHCNKNEQWFNHEATPDNCSIRVIEVDKAWMNGKDFGHLNPQDLTV